MKMTKLRTIMFDLFSFNVTWLRDEAKWRHPVSARISRKKNKTEKGFYIFCKCVFYLFDNKKCGITYAFLTPVWYFIVYLVFLSNFTAAPVQVGNRVMYLINQKVWRRLKTCLKINCVPKIYVVYYHTKTLFQEKSKQGRLPWCWNLFERFSPIWKLFCFKYGALSYR